MHTVFIGLGGGTATAGSYGLSKMSAGAVGDVLLFVAIVGLVLTVGLVAASVLASWYERERPPRDYLDQPAPSRRWLSGVGKQRCGSCRRKKTQLGSTLEPAKPLSG